MSKRRVSRVSAEEFVKVYMEVHQVGGTIRDVANKLHIPYGTAASNLYRMRRIFALPLPSLARHSPVSLDRQNKQTAARLKLAHIIESYGTTEPAKEAHDE